MSNREKSAKDKKGTAIEVGDPVYARFRGGRHEGEVENIVQSGQEAQEEEVKNPPKVIFHDQHGHRVAHNPKALEVEDEDKK